MEFYYKGGTINSDNLEEIESQEDDDGQIRRRFIFKGEENGEIFVQPRKSPPSKMFNADGTMNPTSLKDALATIIKYAKILEGADLTPTKSFENFKKENKIDYGYDGYGFDYDFKRKY